MYDMEEPVLTDISAEDMIVNHYLAIWRDLRVKAIGCKKDPETKDKTYKEIKAVVEELNRAKEKITKEFRYRPKINLRTGLKIFYNNLINN